MSHNFPKTFHYIICNEKLTAEQVKEIFYLAINAGIPIIEKIQADVSIKEIPFFIAFKKDISFNHESITYIDKIDINNLSVSFEDFKLFLQGKGVYVEKELRKIIQLNKHYKAIVTKQNINVGCQIFSHETIKNLYELSQKILNS
jgi:hypothetical protein